ncbi:MAG: 1-deoxy-D-xylulose-5-phosphate synthase [Mycoplasmatales bacterium]
MDINKIKNPSFLRELNQIELTKLAEDIRKFLIESTSKTGGHLGSNLGVVELTMSLHRNFESPKDKLIFDIGHQAYIHKILTGRAEFFPTLRKYEGLSGFLKRKESIHDIWEAGHSSTSISAGAAFAMARDLDNDDNHVVCVIGDGSLTNGMTIEALNHISELQQRIIIVINDNEMSIDKNIGFINKVLSNIVKKQGYYYSKDAIKKALSKTKSGTNLAHFISNVKSKVKVEIQSAQNYFTAMDLHYMGPFDGHDFEILDQAFKEAKTINKPVIFHVKTQKGKGYQFAEENSWHSNPPFEIATGKPLKPKTGKTYSNIVAEGVTKLMETDEAIVVVTPAMLLGSELHSIAERFPKRVTDVGMAEEHAITFCAGLALAGKKPFLSIYSTFLQRGYDQVFHDIDRHNANVVIGIDRAGLVGEDGETHQGIYDIAFLSHMPNSVITQGKDALQTQALIKHGFEKGGPFFVRYPRGGSFSEAELAPELPVIEFGKWQIIKPLQKLNIVTYGPQVEQILQMLNEKSLTEVGLINACFIKPIDFEMIEQLNGTKLLVIEEHTHFGGLYSLILDFIFEQGIELELTPQNLGQQYIEQGAVDLLLKQEGLDMENIYQVVQQLTYK